MRQKQAGQADLSVAPPKAGKPADDGPMDTLPLGLPAPPAEIIRARYQDRLPSALDDLAGPAHGTVVLPLHVAWSGQTAFSLDQPKPCMHMYRIVLAEGQRDDVAAYLNRDLLIRQWPVLRKLISPTVRSVWESAFPDLWHRPSFGTAYGDGSSPRRTEL